MNKKTRSSIRARLIKSFTAAILIPLVTAAAGVLMIREQIYEQAQIRVTSDLESAKEIYNNYLERLKDSLRIHATRMVVYGALEKRSPDGLAAEMERIRAAERLDILTLTDDRGNVFYRTSNPSLARDDQSHDMFVRHVLQHRSPVSSTDIIREEELAKESHELAVKASMEITPTRRAGRQENQNTFRDDVKSGSRVHRHRRFVGVLIGGVLLNRNYEIVDKIRTTVFKGESYKGQQVEPQPYSRMTCGSQPTSVTRTEPARSGHACRRKSPKRPAPWRHVAKPRIRSQRLVHFGLHPNPQPCGRYHRNAVRREPREAVP